MKQILGLQPGLLPASCLFGEVDAWERKSYEADFRQTRPSVLPVLYYS